MKNDNVIEIKSKAFAIRIVRLYQYLSEQKKEFILSRQLLKSGTSIGANIKEAIRGQSKADFVAKMNIALKESSETEYWLEILHETSYIDEAEYSGIYADNKELLKMLTSIIKTAKTNNPALN
ncbi:MAG: four helix bundle protein [Gracilibacteraceae bacterium]|nr:four helix bundle protein [Gracilibacteraceae bacterium]